MRLPTGHNLKFEIGQIVYLVTDPDQRPRMVLSVKLLPDRQVLYNVWKGTEGCDHYEIELSDEQDLLKKLAQ